MKRILEDFMLIVDYDEGTETLHIRTKLQPDVVLNVSARFEGTKDLTIKCSENEKDIGVFIPCDKGFHITSRTKI